MGSVEGEVSPAVPVLLLEDSPGDASLIRIALTRGNPQPKDEARFRIVWVTTLQAAVNHLTHEPAACILADLGLPDADGLDVVDALRGPAAQSPIVVLTGRSDDTLALDAIRRGADDFLLKSDLLAADELSSHKLRRVVTHAVERVESRRRVDRLAARSRAVMNALGNGLLVVDTSGLIIDANPAAGTLLASLDTGRGGRIADVLSQLRTDDGRPLTGKRDPVARAMMTGAPATAESLLLVEPDGQERRIDLQAYPMQASDDPAHDGGAGAEGAVVALHDVSASHAAKQEERFRAALLEAVGQAVVVTDAAERVVVFNRAAEKLYGWSAAEAMGQHVGDVIKVHESAEDFPASLDEAHLVGRTWTGDLDLTRQDGTVFPALVTSTPVFDRAGERVARIGVATDMSQRIEAYETSRALSAIVTSSADAIFTKRLDGTVLSWNAGAEKLYGYRPEEIVGRNVSVLNPSARDEIDELTSRAAQGETIAGHETTRRHRNGSLVAVSITITPMTDERGRVVAASVIARDIGERHRLEHALRQQAMYDPLTGLPNRKLLEDRLQQLLASAARKELPVAVLFCDLDQFKQVNDASGHLTGDKLLKEAANRLAAVVRPADTVARLGGDEFVVLCQADVDQAVLVARRLQESLRKPIVVDGQRHHVTASIGIAVSPPLEADGARLMSHADTAMYEVKAAGRASWRVFDPAMAANSRERLQLANELRDAVDADELQVHYQPQYDIPTGRITGFEALVRWLHPSRGWIAPDRFLHLAAAGGFARKLDEQVLARACRDTASLMKSGLLPADVRVAVNFSASTLNHPDMVAGVISAAAHADLPMTAIEIEVTETGLLHDLEAACAGLGELRSLGVGVALDDFGTGYSSLTYVRQLPVSALKIDRSFIEHLAQSANDRAIASSIVDLAKALELKIVAEGVETAEQLMVLRSFGCSAAQGWLWSRAVPLPELTKLLRRAEPAAIRLPNPSATPVPPAPRTPPVVLRRP